MADSVRITIEADDKTAAGIASAVANLGKLEKASERVTGAPGGSGGKGGKGVSGLSGVMGGLNQMLGAVGIPALGWAAAIGGVVAVTKNAIQTGAKYNENVRDQAYLSKSSATEASKFLQVLDDYQLSAEDAATATKALTKQGLAPNLETIKTLSAEYLKLQDAEDRNAFAQKNLGRASKEWLNLLSQGPDKLDLLEGGLNKNLILTDDQIAKYEEYRLRMDQVSDSVQGAKVAVGNFFFDQTDQIGAGIDKARAIREKMDNDPLRTTYNQLGRGAAGDARIKEMELMYEQAQATGISFEKMKEPLDSATLSYIQMAKAAQENNAQLEGASLDYAAILKGGLAITKMNESYSNSVEGITKQYDDNKFVRELFSNDVKDLKDQLKDGEITNRQYYDSVADMQAGLRDGSYAVQKQTEALGQLEQQIDANSEAYALNLLQQNEALDPKKLNEFAVASGQMTKQAADQANAQIDLADAFSNGQISAETYAAAVKMISGDLSALNGQTATSFINIVIKTNGAAVNVPPGTGLDQSTIDMINAQERNAHGHAGGGKLKGGEWSLLGDAPGGRLTPYSEAVGPDGDVYDAQTTKWLFDNGFLNGVVSRAGGTAGGRPASRPGAGSTRRKISATPSTKVSIPSLSTLSTTAFDSQQGGAAEAQMQQTTQAQTEANNQVAALLQETNDLLRKQATKTDLANLYNHGQKTQV